MWKTKVKCRRFFFNTECTSIDSFFHLLYSKPNGLNISIFICIIVSLRLVETSTMAIIDFSSLFFQHFYSEENKQKDRDSFTSFKKDREEFCLSVSLSFSLLFSSLSVGYTGFCLMIMSIYQMKSSISF